MSVNKVRYPGPGCLVEYMQGNTPTLAVVLEEQGGRFRLYGINHRESTLAAGRLLPWTGPQIVSGGGVLSRSRMDEAMEECRALRASIASEVSALEVWELTQTEVGRTSAEWLAGLVFAHPSIDQEAALGHALLAARNHFRFSPPDFEIFPESVVNQRMQEAEAARVREAFAITGARFFHTLWEIHNHERPPLRPGEEPEPELAQKLRDLLFARLADPDGAEDAATWKLLTKGLPDLPYLALSLTTAWGLTPEHYNFLLDRAGFERGEGWAAPFAAEMDALRERASDALAALPALDTPFVSVDPASTRDRDDAFCVRKEADGGFRAEIALACPAHAWPFGGDLDKAALRRGSSLYLPEGDEHMLPASVGRELFSLDAGQSRPSLVVRLRLSPGGEVLDTEPLLCRVVMADNLDLESSEAVLRASGEAQGRAVPHADRLRNALELAQILQARRIADGAVITERPDPEIRLEGTGSEARVVIEDGPEAALTHFMVGEMMILANSAVALWASGRGIPLLFRTQDVALPREFAGVWTEPHEISRVVRALPPASLEHQPRRHAGLGLAAYTNISSPIRRYVDLLNQGQILSYLVNGTPRLDDADMRALLPFVSSRLDAVTQIQRMRPRYWKLLFFRQQGDKQWWDAVVADENEAFVTISLPWAQLLVRGRRSQFDEKIYPGMQVQVRLGKVNPLLNEVRIMEVREA
jgi:exoribonuclease-2